MTHLSSLTSRLSVPRVVLVCSVLVVGLAVDWTPSVAAGSLALPRSDYPHGARIAVIPATNAAADRYLAPVHRSNFERLHRLDGVGWLQFGTWSFHTGHGTSRETHRTIYGYGVNVFTGAGGATRALKDIKIPTAAYRVAHLPALRFLSTDANFQPRLKLSCIDTFMP